MRVLSNRDARLLMPRYSTVNGVGRYRWPSQKHLTPTHCGGCGARLLLADIPTADDPLVDVACLACSRVACELASDAMRQPLTAEQFRTLPQRRRGSAPQHMCADCPRQILRENVRCRDCERTRRETQSVAARVVAALASGHAIRADALASQLGTTTDTLRHAIRQARQSGQPIVKGPQGYRLELLP